MNYKKVIKDLKERNDKLQEQYILRDIRCIHLEYENEMLKSDFKAQHELTKKYAKIGAITNLIKSKIFVSLSGINSFTSIVLINIPINIKDKGVVIFEI